MPVPTLATIENMRRYTQAHLPSRDGAFAVFAWSPTTGEEYSANADDYWNARPGWTMHDSRGEPMILARRDTRVVALTD